MARQHVAFFRNLNVGQRGSPTTAQIVEAFTRAGATDVTSVRSNGTVLFRSTAPARTRDRVCSSLIRHTDWCDVAPVRDAPWVLALAERLRTLEGNAEVAVFDARRDFPQALPWRPEGARVTVVEADRRHALAVDDEPRTSYATPVLERLLGVPVTSRGAATLLRVADLLAARGR
jgi:uncharacterized protein (DUF1697 family)